MDGCVWSPKRKGETAKRTGGEAGLLADPGAWKVRRADGERRVDRTDAAIKYNGRSACRYEQRMI